MPTPLKQILVFALLLALASPAAGQAGDPVVVDPPITVRVNFVEGRRSLLGDLVGYDTETLTLVVRGERQVHKWIDVTPSSAFTARYRLIDQKSAPDWLKLGEFALEIGAETEAEKALHWALRLDPALEEEVGRIRLEAPGRLRGPLKGVDQEPELEAEPESDGAFGGPSGELLSDAPGIAFFEPVAPEHAARVMEEAERSAERSLKRLGVVARRLETEHFVIFTDWEPIDDEFLRDSLERAYRLVALEFGIPPQLNVFVGKLPVYMFDDHADFMRYAHQIDGQKKFTDTVAGYYTGRSDGMGKLIMSKPRQTDRYGLEVARQIWRRNLTHEFSHAFFARYRSNAFVPRWLNEGVAEVIAEKVYPRFGAHNQARMMARDGKSISSIFDDRSLPGPELYPVMLTLIEAMQTEDPKKFRDYIDRVKAGENAEAALKEMYGVDYRGLEVAWRRHMLQK